MKESYSTKRREFITITFTRKQAELFNDMFGRDEIFKDVCQEIDEELRPMFVYKITCRDCPRVFKVELSEKLTEQEINKGGICSICSDDYK